jgi:hypothetical protein
MIQKTNAMIIDEIENDQKIIYAILYFIENAKGLNKYSLSKLLYYADAFHYQKYSTTITGKMYIHIEQSPIPEGMNELLCSMVLDKIIIVRPLVKKNEKNIEMVFDAVLPGNLKIFSSNEAKILRYISFLLGKKVQDESRVFPLLYEHYIITDLFTPINFEKIPKEKPPKMTRKRKLVEIGDKIYRILFESN